ncbi:MAG: type II toxin-antitoxin system RelE/ParE family toxin, partial [Youngiibacter sp.]|nr:type II toxin-antitoxin system RelE/ParE family toxin [Youngiibacter sp.]
MRLIFTIKFYETKSGVSDVWDFLEELRERSLTNDKNSRIQYNQIVLQIHLLQRFGTRQSEQVIKHLDERLAQTRD